MARWRVVGLLALGVAAGVTAQEAPRPKVAGSISSILLADPRLEQPISLRRDRIYLGELLDYLSDQTNVPVTVSDRWGPMSGYELTVSLRSRPAREVMEAVRRLYSTPPDRWIWSRTERDDPGYLLLPSLSCNALREARASFSERYLIEEFDKRSRFYKLPPQQRDQLAQRDPMLKAANDSRNLGFHSFMEGLSQADVLSIIRGQPLRMPMERLTPSQREFVVSEFRRANLLGKPGVKQPSDLQGVTLIYPRHDFPTIYLDLGPVGAHGVIGGAWSKLALDDWRNQVGRRWLGSGEDRRVPTLPLSPTTGNPPLLFDRALHSVNRSIYRGQDAPAIMRLEDRHVTWKRWGDYVLARPRDWDLCDRESAIPWPLRRDLRRAAAAGHGYLRPQDWIRMSRLELEQLWNLAEEFPDADTVGRLKPLIGLWTQLSDEEQALVGRPEGAGWADFSLKTRTLLARSRGPEAARAFRFHLSWNAEARPPRVKAIGYQGPTRRQPIEYLFQPRSSPTKDRS